MKKKKRKHVCSVEVYKKADCEFSESICKVCPADVSVNFTPHTPSFFFLCCKRMHVKSASVGVAHAV